MIAQHPSIDQMKESMRAPWIAGDFGAIAREMAAPEADGFVALMELTPGAPVLDIACGTGKASTLPKALDVLARREETARRVAAELASSFRPRGR